MGSECSTLWHKVSGQNISKTFILQEFLKFSTAYVWIGMISRSNPSRDGVVIRAQRYTLFTFYYKIENKSYVFSRRINHPSFNNGSPPNYDFQLIELSTSVDLTHPKLSHVFPACWPTSEPTSGRVMMYNCAYIYIFQLTYKSYSKVVISGWGTTSSGGSQPTILQKVLEKVEI